MWKNIKETLLLISIASACIWGLHYMITKYEPPIYGDKLVIVTDEDGDEKIYRGKLPSHSVLRGSDLQTIACFQPVEIIDTMFLQTVDGCKHFLIYRVNCRLNIDAFGNHDIDILRNINSQFDKHVNNTNNRIKYLCVSIPVRYGPRAGEYIDKNLKDDIKWIVIDGWFKVDNVEITDIRKENS